jgi:hypothetical protein
MPPCCVGTARWRELFDMDEPIQVQIARLESDVQHIQTDVSDIKTDLRRTNDKIDATNDRVDALRDRVDQGFREVRQDIASAKIWAMGLYFALAGGLLLVMAKGFKWI